MAPTSLDAHKPRIRIGEYKLVGLLALFLVGGPLIGLLVLATSHEQWLPPLQAMGSSAAPLFVLTASVLAGLCLIPTHAASLVGGLLFGAFAGSAWALTAVVGAALLGFLLLRAVVSGWAAAMIERHPGALSVQRALLRSGRLRAIGIIALVRLSPVMPFGGTNLLVVVGGGKLAESYLFKIP